MSECKFGAVRVSYDNALWYLLSIWTMLFAPKCYVFCYAMSFVCSLHGSVINTLAPCFEFEFTQHKFKAAEYFVATIASYNTLLRQPVAQKRQTNSESQAMHQVIGHSWTQIVQPNNIGPSRPSQLVRQQHVACPVQYACA